jgi:pyruvate,water dikinase
MRKDLNVSGIITDMGGMTCHAAIVARELRIPYIAGAIDATKKLKNNVLISMDSERGVIYGEA